MSPLDEVYNTQHYLTGGLGIGSAAMKGLHISNLWERAALFEA